MNTKPVAILGGIEELRQRVNAGHRDFAIMLAGGAALSRKHISRHSNLWHIANAIDDSRQSLADGDLWTESNIGEALDKGALLDLDGDTGLVRFADTGLVTVKEAEARVAASVRPPTPNTDPLVYRLDESPGAIRVGVKGEWEPADPSLLLEVCEIGPYTVANIDIAATGGYGSGRKVTAATSIELTLEDIDDMVATLLRIRQDAIDHRNFALNAEGHWTNGSEND